MVRKKNSVVVLLLIGVVPIAALWTYYALQALNEYEGTCGLLERAWPCSKAQYVEYTLFSVFVFPFLAAVSIGWLIAVGIVAWTYSRLRKQRRTA